jgi:hypothetical protein
MDHQYAARNAVRAGERDILGNAGILRATVLSRYSVAQIAQVMLVVRCIGCSVRRVAWMIMAPAVLAGSARVNMETMLARRETVQRPLHCNTLTGLLESQRSVHAIAVDRLDLDHCTGRRLILLRILLC